MRRRDYSGASNPNWRDAGKHECLTCGKEFKRYNKGSKYCSQSCAAKANSPPERLQEMARRPRKARKKVGRRCVCRVCNVEFFSLGRRLYCDEHTAIGRANKGFSRRNWSTKDKNHDDVVKWFRARGAGVLEMHALGSGMPDLIVAAGGHNHLVEVKNPNNSYGKRGLTEIQQVFADHWPAPVAVVRTEHDVESLMAQWQPSKTEIT